MWKLRIEKYIQLQDYALWEVIENGNSFKPQPRVTANADGTSTSTIPGSQISGNSRKGLGYNDVPPLPTGLFAPPSIDLSNYGVEEFKQPKFEGYGVKVNKSVCENSSNEIKKTPYAPIIEEWVSDSDEDESEVMISDNVQHKTWIKKGDSSRCFKRYRGYSISGYSRLIDRKKDTDENQLGLKIPRKDNMYSFDLKNIVPSKGIKREFSNAKTPQQNGVAERKNRTLIEAARTMLADSLLPIPFWAEAVNTACFVQNMVLVTKPHNKTPYELLIGGTPIISFMRPFGCPVTILNTLDHLGKFDGKANEGVIVGYSINNKAFRVNNHRTRKVEENLHVNFLENKPNVPGNGPEWLFDIDSLTNTMNYQVSAGNITNGNAGIETNSDVGQAGKDKVPDQEYILLPLVHTSSYVPSSFEEAVSSPNDDAAGKKTEQEPANEEDQTLKDAVNKMMNKEKETTEHSDDVRNQFEAKCNKKLFQGLDTRTSSTNSFNNVNTLVNNASASRTFYHVGPSSGPPLVSFNGSLPIDVHDYPDDPFMPNLKDTAEPQGTGIFNSAYDDDDFYNSLCCCLFNFSILFN
ncbi:ribonuclease H-like domain-containing protein [Tanacetum coccineum]